MKARLLMLLVAFTLIVTSAAKCDLTYKATLTDEQRAGWRLFRLEASKVDKVLVLTISGSLDDKIHGTVLNVLIDDYRYFLHLSKVELDDGTVEERTWYRYAADATAHSWDKDDIREKVQNLIAFHDETPTSRMSLLVVGKSAGGVLAWATFAARTQDVLDDFRRVALVLVDPHGRVYGDGKDAYREGQGLTWPNSWPDREPVTWLQEYFRVYNIFQHHDAPTGATFTDKRVCENENLTHLEVDHDHIATKYETKRMIARAFEFAWYGEDWWCEENLCP